MHLALVSVLMPCYNHEHFVVDALDSVLFDSYPNKEIIIIDDGSSDSSNELILQWIEDHGTDIPVKYTSRKNVGLTKTLNELVEQAKGSYITILATDDMLIDGGIQKRLDILINNPSKYVVICDAHVIDMSGVKIYNSAIEDLHSGNKLQYSNSQSLKYSLINNWSIPGPVMLARKDIYDVIGLYPENYVIEDLNFYIKVVSRNLLIYSDDYVAKYRIHNSNHASNSKAKLKAISCLMKTYTSNIFLFELKFTIPILKRLKDLLFFYMKVKLGRIK